MLRRIFSFCRPFCRVGAINTAGSAARRTSRIRASRALSLWPGHRKITPEYTTGKQPPKKTSRLPMSSVPVGLSWMHYNALMSDSVSLHAALPTAEHPLLCHLAEAQARAAFFAPPAASQPASRVVLAVSGGLDSIVLLHALARLAPAWQLDLHVAHVDHALRPESSADAALVQTLATELALPWHGVRLDATALRNDPAGLEAAARRARYRALCAIACNVTPADLVPILVTAHHAQDQAETVLLRLVQGSGLQGLAAMRPVKMLTDATVTSRPVRLVRPLLDVVPAVLRDYAAGQRLIWRDDPTNADTRHPRNLIRHAALPLLASINPQIVATLARTATLLAADADRLAAQDQEVLARIATVRDNARILLDLTALQQLAPAARDGLLRAAILELAADLRELGAVQIEQLATAIARTRTRSGPHPLAARLAWSVVAMPDRTLHLALHRVDALPLAPPGPWLDDAWRHTVGVLPLPLEGPVVIGRWELSSSVAPLAAIAAQSWQNPAPWTAYFDAGAAASAVLTTPYPGLWIDPLGMAGRRKRVGDLFTDAKLTPGLRPGWPIIAANGAERAIWVCGLAQSHAARITAQTTHVRILCWRQLPAAAS